MSVGTWRMAGGGFRLLLVAFHYLVGLVLINLAINMNYRNRNTLRVLQLCGSACLVYIETYHRRSGAVRHGAEYDSMRRHLAPVR